MQAYQRVLRGCERVQRSVQRGHVHVRAYVCMRGTFPLLQHVLYVCRAASLRAFPDVSMRQEGLQHKRQEGTFRQMQGFDPELDSPGMSGEFCAGPSSTGAIALSNMFPDDLLDILC